MQMIEIVLPVLTSVALCGVGMLVFSWWGKREEAPPLWFVAVVWVGALFLYLAMTRYLWVRADEAVERFLPFAEPGGVEQRLTGARDAMGTPGVPVLMYCFLLWLLPVFYYTRRFKLAFEAQSVEPRTWTSMEIPDGHTYPDSQGMMEAKNLAMLGDIDGAVEKYKGTVTKRVLALFSAASLLEGDGRNQEAAELYQEIANQSLGDLASWAKAMFRLAKLTENALHDQAEAASLLGQIVVRAPDTEFGQMASAHLTRLRPDSDALFDMLDSAYDNPDVQPIENDQPMTLENPQPDEGDAAEM